MLSEDKYFNDLNDAELWQRYCGFLDLTISDFMAIQEELLLDQIDRIADSLLGKKIMKGTKPKSVDEFRKTVPLTDYDDYMPYLGEQQEGALAEKPCVWCHSSGKGGYFKWIPYTPQFLDEVTKRILGCLILASSQQQKGRVNLSPGFRFLVMLPPVPYASGALFQGFAERFSFQIIPPPKVTQQMDFQEKLKKGFEIALKDGVDMIGGIASVLVKMGDQFGEQARGTRFSASMLHPKTMRSLVRALLRSKTEKRSILPKDLWPAKAIVTGGVDTAIYKDAVAHYWGIDPYEFYICAEGAFIGMQGWTRKAMTFLPDLQFLEFIPYEELVKQQNDSTYMPTTVLLDELKEGELYAVVITQLYGMPLLRYRLNDIIKVVSLRDDEAEVALPQMVFQRRVGESINIAGLAELDEKIIWQAIANTGLRYVDWSACKEYDKDQAYLRLYIELKEQREAEEVATMIDEQLKVVDTDYKDIDSYLNLQPVRLTLLIPGTFERYMQEKSKEGADLAHLKPAHINPPPDIIERLIEQSNY